MMFHQEYHSLESNVFSKSKNHLDKQLVDMYLISNQLLKLELLLMALFHLFNMAYYRRSDLNKFHFSNVDKTNHRCLMVPLFHFFLALECLQKYCP